MGRETPGEQSAPEKAETRDQVAALEWQWRGGPEIDNGSFLLLN